MTNPTTLSDYGRSKLALSRVEAGKALGVSVITIDRFVKRGLLRPPAPDLLGPFRKGFGEGNGRLQAAGAQGGQQLEELTDRFAAGAFGLVL